MTIRYLPGHCPSPYTRSAPVRMLRSQQAAGNGSRRHRARPVLLAGAVSWRWAGTAASAEAACPEAVPMGVVVERERAATGETLTGIRPRPTQRASSSGERRVASIRHGPHGCQEVLSFYPARRTITRPAEGRNRRGCILRP